MGVHGYDRIDWVVVLKTTAAVTAVVVERREADRPLVVVAVACVGLPSAAHELSVVELAVGGTAPFVVGSIYRFSTFAVAPEEFVLAVASWLPLMESGDHAHAMSYYWLAWP